MHDEFVEGALHSDLLRGIATEVMEISDITTQALGDQEVLRLRGRLRLAPQAAYAYLAPRFRALGYTPLLQQEGDGVALIATPGRVVVSRSRLWVALLLLGLTIASTVFVGGLTATGIDLGLGLAYSAALLSILMAHELGHFLMARRLGVAVSYPFFIPLPLPPLGTMGAFIAMKEPPPDRRALLQIAIAGPLAGLAVAVPVLALGLLLSDVQPATPTALGGLTVGNSLLYAAVKIAVFGHFVPNAAESLLLHPVAFAGWAGLLVTGLNLLPAGQLDGGHILYALVGPRFARLVTWSIAALLVVMGFLWSGWFLWALLIVLFGQRRAPLLNEVTPLDGRLRLVALLGLAVFVLVFTPTPLTLAP